MQKSINFLGSLWPILGLACLGGCGVDVAELSATVQQIQQDQGGGAGHLTGLEGGSVGGLPSGLVAEAGLADGNAEGAGLPKYPGSELLAKRSAYHPPYPERTDPFEFMIEVDQLSQSTSTDSQSDIKLYGFIGDTHPKAIINVGGRTRVMQEGEGWGGIELVEIAPPEVRIRVAGVMRTWSLLGHQERSAAASSSTESQQQPSQQ